jgi:HEAT repeat protein
MRLPCVRTHAAQALWRIDHRPEVIPTLQHELQSHDTMAQGVAIETLAEIGPAACESLPALYDLLSNRDFEIREEAATAISKIDPNATNDPIKN